MLPLSSDAVPSRDIDELVGAERTRTLYAKVKLPLLVVLGNSAIVAAELWSRVPSRPLVVWTLAVWLVTALRFQLSWRYFRAKGAERDYLLWLRWFVAGAFANGIIWGTAGVVFFPPQSTGYQLFLVFVLGGMAAGAATSLAIHPKAFMAYAVPALLPIIVRLFLEGDRLHIVMAGMLLLFTGSVTLLARSTAAQFVQLQVLRFDNANLAQALRKHSVDSADRFRRLFDQAGEGALVADAATLEIVEGNVGASRLLGEPLGSLVGDELTNVTRKLAPRPDWCGIVKRVADGEVHVVSGETRVSKRSVHLELRTTLSRYDSRDYVLVVLQDVSERRAMESELARSNLLASVGSVAAGMAHEINNPLSYVSANLEYLTRHFKGEPGAGRGATPLELKGVVDDAVVGTQQIRAVVESLAPAGRSSRESGSKSKLADTVELAVRLAGNQLRHQAQLSVTVPEHVWVEGDASKIAQVILNPVAQCRASDEFSSGARESDIGHL